MGVPVVRIDTHRESASVCDDVVKLLLRGGVIGYPTETVYGLGGDATLGFVVQRVCQLKGRHFGKPLLVLVSDEEAVSSVAADIPEKARTLMDRFWPGPLTLIFEAKPTLPRPLTGEQRRVGVRVSSDPVCRAILKQFQKPLVSTSANTEGRRPASTAEEVLRYFGETVDLIVDGGRRGLMVPSTLLDVSEDPPHLLRRGAVAVRDIERVIGEFRGVYG
jgi:L-threonylcarbamoyladenylate synthase